MPASIWWTPYGGTTREIALSQDLTEIEEGEERDEAVSESISGRRSITRYSSRVVVRVISELITDQSEALNLEALVNHLRRGGTIAVAEDSDRTLGGFLSYAPNIGAGSVHWHENMYKNLGGSFTPQNGEVLYLRGPSPNLMREPLIATGGSTHHATLSKKPKNDWRREPWVFIHNQRFWPLLRLSTGRTRDRLLISERRVHYTLDLPLEESPWALSRLAREPVTLIPPDVGDLPGDEYVPTMESFESVPIDGIDTGGPDTANGPGNQPVWWR